jgi:hypothetical protein
MLTVLTMAIGDRAASYADLKQALDGDDVSSMAVSGELEAGANGFSTVTIRWTSGPWGHVTQVRESRPLHAGLGDGTGGVPVVEPGIVDRLQQRGADIEVRRVADERNRLSGTLLGWDVPSGVSLSAQQRSAGG